jgi:hypothetical protein
MKTILFATLLAIFIFQAPEPEVKLSKIGTFDGRTPCQELAKMLDEKAMVECIKIKWRLTLYVDSITRKPDTYSMLGFIYKKGAPRRGTWSIVKGAYEDPEAIVYRLDDNDGKPPLFLLKGDDNVLFFLDSEKKHLVGNKDFSFALNRIPGK